MLGWQGAKVPRLLYYFKHRLGMPPHEKPNNVLRPASSAYSTTPLHDQITPHAGLKQESQFGSSRYFKKGRPYPVLSQCERRPWRVPIFDSLDLAHSLASLLNLRMPCLESTHTFLFLVKSGEQSGLRGGPNPIMKHAWHDELGCHSRLLPV